MDAAQAISLGSSRQRKALFDGNAPLYEWFSDGMVNTCYNAVDRHVENGRADQVAIIYDSPITGRQSAKTTYAELQIARRRKWPVLSGRKRRRPKATASSSICRWCTEALIAMLAVTRIGAVHSVVYSVVLPRTNWPCGSTTPSRKPSSPRPAGWSPAVWSPINRFWMAPLRSGRAQARLHSDPSARRSTPPI